LKFGGKLKKLVKISTPTNANLGYITPILYLAITRQQLELESCSSPLQIGKVLFRLKKNLSLGCRVFCWCLYNYRMLWHVFTFW